MVLLNVDLMLIQRVVTVRRKAIETALSLTSGAYQTSLVSYLTHRDLFPSLMKVRLIPENCGLLLMIG